MIYTLDITYTISVSEEKKKYVWIYDDSLVYWAAQHTLQLEEGPQMGLDQDGLYTVWKGYRGAYLTD